MLVLFLTVGVLHLAASIYHLYWSVYEFDSLVHFFGGAAISVFFAWFYFFSGFFTPTERSLTRFLMVSILGGMFVAISWESFELIFKQTTTQKMDYAYDTTMDLIMDFLGALAGCFYAYIGEYNRKMIIKNQQ